MIGRGEVTKTAQAEGVDARTIERDYVLAHVAVGIADVAGESLVLKGGTCLRMAHYADYRYSADLDYSLSGIDLPLALNLIEQALRRSRERVGFDRLSLDVAGDQPRIEYVGPLEAKPRRIKLDLDDSELVLAHARLSLIVGWRDLPEAATLVGYSLGEICAEKFRCVIQRRQCRDIYDLWSLLDGRGGVDLFDAWHGFERKAEHRDLDPMYLFARWDSGVDWYAERWEVELADYLGEGCPDFGAVSRAIGRRLGELREYVGQSPRSGRNR